MGRMAGIVALLALVGLSQARASEISDLFRTHGYKTNIVKPPQGLLKHPYLVPSGPYFQLFEWDMYFMSVALSYDGVADPVKGSVESFLDYVDPKTGYVPRMIAPDKFWGEPQQCKPFLAQAAVRASLSAGGDFRWIAPYYDRLVAYLGYWDSARRSNDGLFLWYNGEESGSDNNPAVTDEPTNVTEGVDLAVFMIRDYRALARIARELGHRSDEKRFLDRADEIGALVQKRMWSEEDGLYYDIDSRTGMQIRIKSWVSLLPLWIGLPDAKQAKQLIEGHLLNPSEFWAAHGVRSLSKDEPLYDPAAGYWQGPVWVVSNYLLMHGLMNYGYASEARKLAATTVDFLVADIHATGGMNECYNPETGAPTADGMFVSWDLLAEHMQEEAALGFDPTATAR